MVLTERRVLEPREIPIPALGDDQALVRIETCGICGSDVEQFDGLLRTPWNVIPGHEPLGVVAAIGDGLAQRWKVDVGDRIAVENMFSCRLCAACVSGRPHLCPERRIYSMVPLEVGHGLHGAYSQYMIVDGNTVVHRIDPALPPELAVLFNPLGAGYRWAVELPGTQPGMSVLVIGPGQRGLASVVAAREAGASTIAVAGLAADATKLALCERFGADHTIDVENESLIERGRELTDGRGFDVVVEVSAVATEPVRQALDLVAIGGTIVLAGVKGFRPIPDFVSDKIVVKEIRVLGAIGVTSSAYRNAIRTIESRRVPLEAMHTHDFALRDAETAIRALAREIPGEDAIHCCLFPEH